MALQTETVEINGRDFIHTYSDAGLCIERDGVEYEEAYDPAATTDREYKETDTPVTAGPEEGTEV